MREQPTIEQTKERIRHRMAMLAGHLINRLGALDAAQLFLASAVVILRTHFGDQTAVAYLRGCADEIEVDETPPEGPTMGHA